MEIHLHIEIIADTLICIITYKIIIKIDIQIKTERESEKKKEIMCELKGWGE